LINTSNSVHSSPGTGAVGSNSADVNKPFSYDGLDVEQLNQTRLPQTKAIVEQVQVNPKPVPISPSTDQATKLQDQVTTDSNTQMNNLLSLPAIPSVPAVPTPATPESRMDQLK
jgi:filamentous hemagglutinin